MSEIRKSKQIRRYVLADGTIKTRTAYVDYVVKNKNSSKKVRVIITDEDIINIMKVWDELKYKNYKNAYNEYNKQFDKYIPYAKIISTVKGNI
tara:strand:+ start:154 stop:432 length:279 start_codon:yes stop_codon:yes gene_type:complete